MRRGRAAARRRRRGRCGRPSGAPLAAASTPHSPPRHCQREHPTRERESERARERESERVRARASEREREHARAREQRARERRISTSPRFAGCVAHDSKSAELKRMPSCYLNTSSVGTSSATATSHRQIRLWLASCCQITQLTKRMRPRNLNLIVASQPYSQLARLVQMPQLTRAAAQAKP